MSVENGNSAKTVSPCGAVRRLFMRMAVAHTAGWEEMEKFIILSEGYLPCLSKDVSRHLHLDEEWFVLYGL